LLKRQLLQLVAAGRSIRLVGQTCGRLSSESPQLDTVCFTDQ